MFVNFKNDIIKKVEQQRIIPWYDKKMIKIQTKKESESTNSVCTGINLSAQVFAHENKFKLLTNFNTGTNFNMFFSIRSITFDCCTS